VYKGLEEAIINLLHNQRFYGEFLVGMNKQFDYNMKYSAGVSITNQINLYINPKLYNQFDLEHRTGILIHECEHVVKDHIKRMGGKVSALGNIGADRAINEFINNLSKGNKVYAHIPDSAKLTIDGEERDIQYITVENFKKLLKTPVDVKNGETMEYYVKLLQEHGDPEKIQGQETCDDHGKMQESSGEGIAREVVKNAVNRAHRRAGAGNSPNHINELVERMNAAVTNWRQQLQRFVARNTDMDIDSTRKRISRRFGLYSPGNIKTPRLKVGVAIDTSGSVSDKYLGMFLGQLDHFTRLGMEVHVVQADMTVNASFEYKQGMKIEIKGRGGTLFQPAIDELEKTACDVIIYFTDGETFSEVPKSKKPVLWCLCPSYTIPTGWTEKDVIKIKEDNGT
jgi:predicted metal-dependent peptidase